MNRGNCIYRIEIQFFYLVYTYDSDSDCQNNFHQFEVNPAIFTSFNQKLKLNG